MHNPHEGEHRSHDRRRLPRYPIHHETLKLELQGASKVFAVRDLSSAGVGIELLEHSEVLLFPEATRYEAELNLDGSTFPVKLQVARNGAATVGFEFIEPTEDLLTAVRDFIDPLHISHSLREIAVKDAPDAYGEGISLWYHGDLNTDLYLWLDAGGKILRALLTWNGVFWEWSGEEGSQTGALVHDQDGKSDLTYDPMPQHKTVYQARKILENASVIPQGLVDFLLHTE